MVSASWAQELQTGIRKATLVIHELAEENHEDGQSTREQLLNIVQQFRAALQKVWMGDDGLFEIRQVSHRC